jgi:hypothetical protein
MLSPDQTFEDLMKSMLLIRRHNGIDPKSSQSALWPYELIWFFLPTLTVAMILFISSLVFGGAD